MSITLSRRQLLAAALLLPASTASARKRGPRVIVVGAGFGGASCARQLRLYLPDADILLIDRQARFLTGPFSNGVIAGLDEVAMITQHTRDVATAHRVRVLIDEVVTIDPVKREVRTAQHGVHRADRIVVAPGVSMRWDRIEGLSPGNSDAMPHGWLGGTQVTGLRDRFAALADGARIVIAAPSNPYRCPPGPYERASLMAAALQRRGHRNSRILIADAKDDFTKRALFQLEWDRRYPGVIEWIPRALNGEVVRVDTQRHHLWLRDATMPIQADLASVIPAQTAAQLAIDADLTDETQWCPVHPQRFESTRHAGIHVIGDAAIAAPMPKSGFAANSQAKLCAAAIAADLLGQPMPQAMLLNTCYSLLDTDAAISVSGYYAVVADRLSVLSEGISALGGDATQRRSEAEQARAWYRTITRDSFG